MTLKRLFRSSTSLGVAQSTMRKKKNRHISRYLQMEQPLEPIEFAKNAEQKLTSLGIDVNVLRTPIDVFNRIIKRPTIKKRPLSAPTTIMGLVHYSHINNKCFIPSRRCITPN